MNNIIHNANNLHDKAVGQAIVSAFKNVLASFDVAPVALDADMTEFVEGGRYIHDREIGRALKASYKAITKAAHHEPFLYHHPVS